MIWLRLSGDSEYIWSGWLRFPLARQIHLYFVLVTCYHESVTIYVALQKHLVMKARIFV